MSRYSILLAKIIAESGLTAKEVVEKCNEMDNGIDVTRLSKLQSGKLPAPSEKVSRDIAKVCNVDDRELVIEGYIEKAPKEIIDAFFSIKYMTSMAALQAFGIPLNKKNIKEIKEELEKEPLAEYIVSLIDNKEADITIDDNDIKFEANENNGKTNLNVILNNPSALKVKDNSMYPTIPENSRITLKIQEKYKDGDILAIKLKDKEDFIVRYVLFKENSIVLTSLNPKDFETLEYKTKDIIILGKVISVTTNIQD